MGSLSKRELELKLLQAAIEAGLAAPNGVEFAAKFRLTLARANSYLTDLALRKPPLNDLEGVTALMSLLPVCEVVAFDRHLSIPIDDAALRLWLERKLASDHLNPGETVRRDLVKLTPQGLLRLLDESVGIGSPSTALAHLDTKLPEAKWIESAKTNWTPKTTWRDTFSTFESVLSLVQSIPTLVSVVMGL